MSYLFFVFFFGLRASFIFENCVLAFSVPVRIKSFKGFKKRTQRSIVKTGKQVAKVTAPVTTPVAKFAKASPLATTIAGIEVAKITPGLKRFFTVKPPLPPKVKGGKVGRRTAG